MKRTHFNRRKRNCIPLHVISTATFEENALLSIFKSVTSVMNECPSPFITNFPDEVSRNVIIVVRSCSCCTQRKRELSMITPSFAVSRPQHLRAITAEPDFRDFRLFSFIPCVSYPQHTHLLPPPPPNPDLNKPREKSWRLRGRKVKTLNRRQTGCGFK